MHHHPDRHLLGLPRIIAMFIGGAIIAIVFGLIFGYFVQLLWNWLMPAIFGLGKISYWQGFGLIILAKFIFGYPGPHFGKGVHGGHGPFGSRHFHRHSPCYDECGDELKIKGSWRNWDYYEEWWRAEGKEAFEKYIDRVNNDGKKEESS